jgi:hypothetical protein
MEPTRKKWQNSDNQQVAYHGACVARHCWRESITLSLALCLPSVFCALIY